LLDRVAATLDLHAMPDELLVSVVTIGDYGPGYFPLVMYQRANSGSLR